MVAKACVDLPLRATASLACEAEWLTAEAALPTAPATGSTVLCFTVLRAWEVLQDTQDTPATQCTHIGQVRKSPGNK